MRPDLTEVGYEIKVALYYLYRCTVHRVVYLSNTPTNAHI